jgi:hypothetical protein
MKRFRAGFVKILPALKDKGREQTGFYGYNDKISLMSSDERKNFDVD